MQVTLLPNSSHLEAINPVALGYCRALMEQGSVQSIQFHGDAAFTGQGVVTESLELSCLKNYSVGGTIHVIVNNQVGFTTEPEDGRSTRYASDIAKAINAPVIHVNGEYPEVVTFT